MKSQIQIPIIGIGTATLMIVSFFVISNITRNISKITSTEPLQIIGELEDYVTEIDPDLLRSRMKFSSLFSELRTIKPFFHNQDFVIGRIGRIVTTQDGTILFVDIVEGKIYLITPDGSINTEIGGRGRGPGEYQQIQWIALHDKLIYVLDSVLWRLSVITLDGDVISTHSIPPGTDKFVIKDRDNLILYDASQWRVSQKPLALYNLRNEKVIYRFGENSPLTEEIGMPLYGGGGLAIDNDQRIFLIHALDYSIYMLESDDGSDLGKSSYSPSHFIPPRRTTAYDQEFYLSFTPIFGPLYLFQELLVFALQDPRENDLPIHYLEFFTSSLDYIGSVRIPERYIFHYIDRFGNFYFSYQPNIDPTGNLPNELLKIYQFNAF